MSLFSDLETVGWSRIQDFLEKCRKLSPNEKERQAEVEKLIANVAVEEGPRYALRTMGWNFLCGTAIGGGTALILNADPFVVTVSGLAGGLSALGVADTLKRQKARELEKKWWGLLR